MGTSRRHSVEATGAVLAGAMLLSACGTNRTAMPGPSNSDRRTRRDVVLARRVFIAVAERRRFAS
jgi:hypothetical protein